MRIVCISDTHGKHDSLNVWLKDIEADVIIHSGDITMFGDIEPFVRFCNWFSGLKFKHKIFIAGNHDRFIEGNQYVARTMVKEAAEANKTEVIYLENDGVYINDIFFYGSPVTPSFFNWAFNVDRFAPIKKVWDKIPNFTDVLITHGPPNGILDESLYDQKTMVLTNIVNHVGCEELMKKINEVKPKIHIFGHIHPDYGTEVKNGTTFVNASIVDSKYSPINKPILLDIDEVTKEVKIINY